jgi:hypothetical protein
VFKPVLGAPSGAPRGRRSAPIARLLEAWPWCVLRRWFRRRGGAPLGQYLLCAPATHSRARWCLTWVRRDRSRGGAPVFKPVLGAPSKAPQGRPSAPMAGLLESGRRGGDQRRGGSPFGAVLVVRAKPDESSVVPKAAESYDAGIWLNHPLWRRSAGHRVVPCTRGVGCSCGFASRLGAPSRRHAAPLGAGGSATRVRPVRPGAPGSEGGVVPRWGSTC